VHNPPKYRTLQKWSPENSISGDEHMGGVEVSAISRWFLLLAENRRDSRRVWVKPKILQIGNGLILFVCSTLFFSKDGMLPLF